MAIGNFDGLHVGHCAIMELARAGRREGGEFVVVTFEPHPLTVLRPQLAPPRICSPVRKRELLAELGVDRLITLAPTPDLLNTTAEAFFAILRDDARVAHLAEGRNFNFGRGRAGNVQRLAVWCAEAGISFVLAPQQEVRLSDLTIIPASSSAIRWLVARGRVRDAAACLGRPFTLEGVVVPGEQRGRTIGFPTANLDCGDQIFPAEGVYAARCMIAGRWYGVALSVGTKPTFHDQSTIAIEAYLLDFAGDLYGQTLRIELLAWIREQTKFPLLADLRAQLERDVAATREVGLT